MQNEYGAEVRTGKPQTSRIILIAVICAIAVFSRILFIWLPYFKPMAAIVIIAGASLGARAGFITGALSAFLSDIVFGYGSWTPWQMLAFGAAGFLAGVLCRRGLVGRLPLCLFGGAVVMLVVGPLLDSSTLFSMRGTAVHGGAVAIYRSGMPVNAIHAAATVLTLLLISQSMLEKLDRIKRKYGIAGGKNR